MERPRCIAITGLGTFLGKELAARLSEGEGAPRVIGLDRLRPLSLPESVEFEKLDLTDPRVGSRVAEVFDAEGVDVLVHLAFRRSPTADLEEDHELETLGTLHLLHACSLSKLRRVVLGSSAMLYGARASNPHYLSEDAPLLGHPEAHCVANRVEAEGLVAGWAERTPDACVTVLRPCWVMGPRYVDSVVAHFEADSVTTVMGYDPLLQFIHEEDLLAAFERAVLDARPGVFNLAGRDALPLSSALALAGKTARPRPMWWLERVAAPEHLRRFGDRPSAFYDYLRHLWLVDSRRGWDAFGEPLYTSREAWMSFVSARRMRRYR